ncbi:MAG: RyR domain-containing protein, partial [Lentimicrobiaceae bacterium]|nr:RyR domain-containing protein [Lentimicrobiaceae bacterium]
KQILILAEETNQYAEILKTKGVKLLIGDFSDEDFWKRAKLGSASKLYAITDHDKTNVKIAQSVFSYLESGKMENDTLRCFVLIEDRKLKTILEESDLFKYKTDFFDSILFNINEMGIKYGIAMNIDKILPARMTTPPEILLVGFSEKTEMALLNLAHCLTMQRKPFRFTIAENNAGKIRAFEKQCRKLPLRDFAEIEISDDDMEKICTKKTFASILICVENPTDAIKQSVEIHYLLGKSAPNILLLCDDVDTFNTVLKEELEKKKIFPINLFGQIAGYVFDLDKNIEEKAKEAHNFWNTLYNQNKAWDEMTGHFKQSNRNQILENYLRMYIARGEKFEDFKPHTDSFSDDEKETLAMMEHRRWTLEKLDNGWVFGERDNDFKRHNCLIPWEKLPKEERAKDYNVIYGI